MVFLGFLSAVVSENGFVLVSGSFLRIEGLVTAHGNTCPMLDIAAQ